MRSGFKFTAQGPDKEPESFCNLLEINLYHSLEIEISEKPYVKLNSSKAELQHKLHSQPHRVSSGRPETPETGLGKMGRF